MNYHQISRINLMPEKIAEATKIRPTTEFAKIAHSYGLSIESCAEKIPPEVLGIKRTCCIDGKQFGKLSIAEKKCNKIAFKFSMF